MHAGLRLVILMMSLLALSSEALSATIAHGDHHPNHVRDHEAGLHSAPDKGEHQSPHTNHACGMCHHILISFSPYRPTLMAPRAMGYRLIQERTPVRAFAPPLQPPMV
ncbi:hypothetical protein [Woodsholea maritima]|uniref:hypothetical protein n=1 Tax=Woodsholea maritima TaxID=240237 RepID=UPI000379614C|nr:hypothetical protein [Woodsholea maritima]